MLVAIVSKVYCAQAAGSPPGSAEDVDGPALDSGAD